MRPDTYTIDSANTRDVGEAERIDYWTHVLGRYHCAMALDISARDGFHGNSLRQRTDRYQLVGWKSDDAVYRRTAGGIRRDPDDDYRLMIPSWGNLEFNARDSHTVVRPGRGVVTTMSVPFALRQHRSTVGFALTIPRPEIDRRLGGGRLIFPDIDLTTGLGRVMYGMVRNLLTERATLTGPEFDAITDRIVELLCLQLAGEVPTQRPHLAELEASIRRYVREHADDPELDGHAVARALGWSLRQVQLALQRSGTSPRRLIKEERLARAMDCLRSPGHRHLTVTDLAYRFGFSSVSAFSSSFRERYGRTPSTVRTEAPVSAAQHPAREARRRTAPQILDTLPGR